MIKLNSTEMAFISRHDISIEEIFDVRGLPGSRWKQDSKEREIPFVYGNACYNGGHRLKNRSGHCIQCDTARIRFIRRETETADLYIAVASNGALFKVGVARDRITREQSLRRDRYGGAGEWRILSSRRVVNAQVVERKIRDELWARKVTGTHIKDGRSVVASEMMSGPLAEIWRVFQKHTKSTPMKDRWQHASLFERYMA